VGLHAVWIGPEQLCRSRITLYYPDRLQTKTIEYDYDQMVEANKDAKFLKESLKQFKMKVSETNV
jgi:hypothetical protein